MRLESAPLEMEAVLRSGWWLVMLAAAWSGPDLMAISTAGEVARRLDGRVRVAVRKFEAHEETRNWLPALQVEFVSPIWVLLHEGELVAFESGLQTGNALVAWAEENLESLRGWQDEQAGEIGGSGNGWRGRGR